MQFNLSSTGVLLNANPIQTLQCYIGSPGCSTPLIFFSFFVYVEYRKAKTPVLSSSVWLLVRENTWVGQKKVRDGVDSCMREEIFHSSFTGVVFEWRKKTNLFLTTVEISYDISQVHQRYRPTLYKGHGQTPRSYQVISILGI